MKKMNKALSLAMTAVLGLSMLAGCGSASGSGSSDEVWKIGGIGPTTGGAAIYGSAVRDGIQIAVDEINAAGGINGYKIEYKFEDDEHNAEKSVNAYNTLKDWGMDLLIGCVTSAPTIAVSEYTKTDNMFMLTPSGTDVKCVQYDNAFRVCFSDPSQGTESAKFIKNKNVGTKVAIIYDSSDTYSTGIHNAFVAEAANVGLEIVADTSFTEDAKTDFSAQIGEAKEAGADLVFLPIYYNEAALILTQSASQGFDPVFFGCDGMDGILGVENFDTSLAEGLVLLTPFNAAATDDLTTKFVATFKEKTGTIPNQFGADAYDAVYAVKAAIEKADLKPSQSVSEIGDGMKGAMTQITISGLTSSALSWNADGEPNKEPMVVKIADGAYVNY